MGLIPIYKYFSQGNAAIAFNKFRGTDFTADDFSKWNEYTWLDGKRLIMRPDFNIAHIVSDRKGMLNE